jgi:hypothetical protein
VLDRTKKSAEAAGLEVLQIISEPCAATLAYQVGLQDPSQNFKEKKLTKFNDTLGSACALSFVSEELVQKQLL